MFIIIIRFNKFKKIIFLKHFERLSRPKSGVYLLFIDVCKQGKGCGFFFGFTVFNNNGT